MTFTFNTRILGGLLGATGPLLCAFVDNKVFYWIGFGFVLIGFLLVSTTPMKTRRVIRRAKGLEAEVAELRRRVDRLTKR